MQRPVAPLASPTAVALAISLGLAPARAADPPRPTAPAAAELLPDGGFERVDPRGFPAGWSRLWTRAPDSGEASGDTDTPGRTGRCVRVGHRGAKDWSLTSETRISVRPGDILELRARLRVEGPGDATACVAAFGPDGKARGWSLGATRPRPPGDGWVTTRARFLVPDDVVIVQPRLIGDGPATVRADDLSLRRAGNIAELRGRTPPAPGALRGGGIAVEFHPADATFAVTDERTGETLTQAPGSDAWIVRAVAREDAALRVELWDPLAERELRVTLAPERARPELRVLLEGDGPMNGPLAYPHPFVTRPGTRVVIPMNEGISYPVDDASIAPMRLIAYGGHGICMGFWGATDGGRGHMAILETPDDAAIRIDRRGGALCVAPEWDPQRGAFGYARALRYVLFDRGGHVAMCKRYRARAREIGLLKTLEEKRAANANVDLLVGAANVWCWDKDPLGIARELKAAGIDRFLWSNRAEPDVIRAMNGMGGILTGRYDIYQDLMDPEIVRAKLGGRVHGDWTQSGWPNDIMLDERGAPRRGWEVRGRDGAMHPCAVLCDARAPDHARLRVPGDLAEHPYRARFIDTTTASPWRECYHPDHPLTRSESRRWKMDLLRAISAGCGLVTGSETGHEAAVPHVHYFEGMLSLGPYRVPDSGRRMRDIVTDIPERVAKFQLGHRYRLPLWELVYHDCVVAQWYWGDYNNKLPALWDRRDLFNALYGTPPMFLFERGFWEANRERFARSYRDTCPVARAVGYAEMIDHEFLTPDRDVQRTRFAGGASVTANFGERPWKGPDGATLPPLSSRFEP